MKRTAGSPPRRRRLFGAGSTATRDNPDARTSSSRHCPPFTLRSSKTRWCAQLSLCDRRRVPGGAGVSGRVAETADPGATRDDLSEAVTTLEDAERTARRVLGSAHPVTKGIDDVLQKSRALLGARETPRGS